MIILRRFALLHYTAGRAITEGDVSLIITRRPGEAIVAIAPDGSRRRLYVISIEGNVVRLAIDAPPEILIIREELLPEGDRRRAERRRA